MREEDFTVHLPARLFKAGCKLFKRDDGHTTKYTLIDTKKKYRSFIYVKNERDASGSLRDLYNNYYYTFNIAVILNT